MSLGSGEPHGEPASDGGLPLDDHQIAALSRGQRSELARRLLAFDSGPPGTPVVAGSQGRPQRSLFLALVASACVVLMPWIVLLAVTLPKSYVVRRWTAVWTGFDIVLLVTIGACVWAAWRRRQVLIVLAVVGATLLTCDAWFDVMTASSRSDLWISAASALFVELPFAVVLLLVARRLLRLTLERARDLAGATGPVPPLYRIGILGLDPSVGPIGDGSVRR